MSLLHASGALKARCSKRANCWCRCTGGSLRGSRRPIWKEQGEGVAGGVGGVKQDPPILTSRELVRAMSIFHKTNATGLVPWLCATTLPLFAFSCVSHSAQHLLTEFDLDRPQPQPPALPRFANAFPCRCDRHSPRL